MIDVFRADPFTAMDLSPTNTTLPSLDSSTAVDGLEYTDGDSLHVVPRRSANTLSHPNSLDREEVLQKACVHSVPFFRPISRH